MSHVTKHGNWIVDPKDQPLLDAGGWFLSGCGYVAKEIGKRSWRHRKVEYLHRLILMAKKGQICDHINGDRLDNRRSNLRICTPGQNSQKAKRHPSSCGYIGVHWHHGAWVAKISNSRIGKFRTSRAAARAYDRAARRKFGRFAVVNFKKVAK